MFIRDIDGAQQDSVHLQGNQPLYILKFQINTVVRILDNGLIPLLPQIAPDTGDHPAGNLGIQGTVLLVTPAMAAISSIVMFLGIYTSFFLISYREPGRYGRICPVPAFVLV